jgi:glutathione-regulated potassium-efflux system protein KefB
VLRASGAAQAAAIAVCVDNRAAASKIVELVKAEFTQARLLVRCFDREHAVELVGKDVDYQIRETFESAMLFGAMALRALGASEEEAAEVGAEVRRRDAARFDLDLAEGLAAGSRLLVGNLPKPEPLTTPQRPGVALSEETALITGEPRPG